MGVPGEPRGAPDRNPLAELTAEERARATRTLVRRLQAGGIVFLAAACMGFLPAVLAGVWPSLGRAATIAVLILAPAIPIAFVVFAALRLRR